MAFQGLILDSDKDPLGNQPVPLRLAPFIYGWSVHQYFELLADNDRELGMMFPIYEYAKKLNKSSTTIVNRLVIERLYETNKKFSQKKFLSAINPSFFIWSDDLKQQALSYIFNEYIDPKGAHESGFQATWKPALYGHRKFIDSCDDFHELLTTSQKRKATQRARRRTTNSRNQTWCAKYKELKAQYLKAHGKEPTNYCSSAANIIQKDKSLNPEGRGTDQIRRVLRNECK